MRAMPCELVRQLLARPRLSPADIVDAFLGSAASIPLPGRARTPTAPPRRCSVLIIGTRGVHVLGWACWEPWLADQEPMAESNLGSARTLSTICSTEHRGYMSSRVDADFLTFTNFM